MLREAPGGRQARDVETLFDRHRQAEEGRTLAGGPASVRRLGLLAGAVEVAHDHGVDLAVAGLDVGDDVLGGLPRGAFAASDCVDEVLCGAAHDQRR